MRLFYFSESEKKFAVGWIRRRSSICRRRNCGRKTIFYYCLYVLSSHVEVECIFSTAKVDVQPFIVIDHLLFLEMSIEFKSVCLSFKKNQKW